MIEEENSRNKTITMLFNDLKGNAMKDTQNRWICLPLEVGSSGKKKMA